MPGTAIKSTTYGLVIGLLMFNTVAILGSAHACDYYYSITIAVNPTAICPSGCDLSPTTATATATLTLYGSPVSGKEVYFTASGTGGGHSHNGTRPVGTFSPSHGTTNANGQVTSTYTASIAGGTYTLQATSQGVFDTCSLDVRVSGLSLLGSGSYYTRKYCDVHHPEYHYGTSDTVSDLQGVASDFHAAYPSANYLVYNDMSLVKGGIFDYCSCPTCNGGHWQTPHSQHRVGRNCDLSNIEDYNTTQRNTLQSIIEQDYGGDVDPEGDHWHLTFPQ